MLLVSSWTMNLHTKNRLRAGLRACRLERCALAVLPVVKRSVRWARVLCGVERRIIHRYMRTAVTRNLHLGCGQHLLDGWLNSDLCPLTGGVLHVDVARRFPFEAATFDVIYSEHLIEHLTYAQGSHMLKECFRVLKPGRCLRISTPDLAFLIALLRPDRSEVQEQYVQWMTEQIGGAADLSGVFVLNHFVRSWGHQFIYDEAVLVEALHRAGFEQVVRCELNASQEPALRDLENEARMRPGFLKLESMVLEARKA